MHHGYMAHFHVKKKNGRPYLYVREIARVQGKPKVINQVYIGSPERVAELASGQAVLPDLASLKVEEFGALWAAELMDQGMDLATLIDQVVPASDREDGPSVGQYFLYAVLNRMVDAQSKNKLADWYNHSAIQHIRPVDVDALTSQRYWDKWDRVSAQQLAQIAQSFFDRLWQAEGVIAEGLLFDTTNYYTFMASDTDSELAQRGHNKAGRHQLRQVGLALLVDRDSRLPLFYHLYPGNLHDSREFGAVLQQMLSQVAAHSATKQQLTVVIDKGMNSEENYAWIDEQRCLHFVTTYSSYFASELASTPLERFAPVDTAKNRRLLAEGNGEDRLLAFRTIDDYWGKQRAVVVTHNPVTARKQTYTLDAKLDALREELLVMRTKVNQGALQWRDPQVVMERYLRCCEHLHIPSDLYTMQLEPEAGHLRMTFQRDHYRIGQRRASFGRNIIVTDHTDWTTSEIVQTNLERYKVEQAFRQSNDPDLVSTMPLRHWTDSKIRCHLFTCVVAMAYLRRLERRLEAAGVKRALIVVLRICSLPWPSAPAPPSRELMVGA
jgi:transposase